LEETKSNLEQIRHEVEQARTKELTFGFKAKPAPDFSLAKEKNKEIKLNTAAILREDALYKKKLLQEKKRIEHFESELRDGSDFFKWQKQKKEEDAFFKQKQIEQRRLEMVQTQFEAHEALEKIKMQNVQPQKNHQKKLGSVAAAVVISWGSKRAFAWRRSRRSRRRRDGGGQKPFFFFAHGFCELKKSRLMRKRTFFLVVS
jgi:hypothetical protein